MNKTVTVIIPSTGNPLCKHSILSVLNQSYTYTRCLVVCDGSKFYSKSIKVLSDCLKDSSSFSDRVDFVALKDNTGYHRYGGNRIYACFATMIESDFIMFLDEDNWLDSEHIAHNVSTMVNNNHDWCYSLRKIYSKDGTFICDDNCLSIGEWGTYDLSIQPTYIDANCYFYSKDTVAKITKQWQSPQADILTYRALNALNLSYGCTKQYTLNYRLDGNPISLKDDHFIEGNALMLKKYPTGDYPWLR